MNLYLLTQAKNTDYDTYDSCVVAAETEQEAILIHPGGGEWDNSRYSAWAHKPEDVGCTKIGTAKDGTPAGVILASYNAG